MSITKTATNMNTKLMIASAIAITVVACGNADTSEINQRVEDLIQYIPDHNKPKPDAKQVYTSEYWSLLDKAWQIPLPKANTATASSCSTLSKATADVAPRLENIR